MKALFAELINPQEAIIHDAISGHNFPVTVQEPRGYDLNVYMTAPSGQMFKGWPVYEYGELIDIENISSVRV